MKISVNNVEYPFPEVDTITYREAKIVKKLTGLRLGEYAEAFDSGDTDIFLGLAAVAVHRSTGQTDLEHLLDLGLDGIQMIAEEEDTELPPAEAPESTSNGSSSATESETSEASGAQDSSGSTD